MGIINLWMAYKARGIHPRSECRWTSRMELWALWYLEGGRRRDRKGNKGDQGVTDEGGKPRKYNILEDK